MPCVVPSHATTHCWLKVACTPRWGTVMLRAVRISQRAQKGLRLAPPQVRRKLKTWIEGVSKDGLEVVREIPGFIDEPLKGKRKGQRSIRLSRSYRAIHQVLNDGTICFAPVEEVTKHGY